MTIKEETMIELYCFFSSIGYKTETGIAGKIINKLTTNSILYKVKIQYFATMTEKSMLEYKG